MSEPQGDDLTKGSTPGAPGAPINDEPVKDPAALERIKAEMLVGAYSSNPVSSKSSYKKQRSASVSSSGSSHSSCSESCKQMEKDNADTHTPTEAEKAYNPFLGDVLDGSTGGIGFPVALDDAVSRHDESLDEHVEDDDDDRENKNLVEPFQMQMRGRSKSRDRRSTSILRDPSLERDRHRSATLEPLKNKEPFQPEPWFDPFFDSMEVVPPQSAYEAIAKKTSGNLKNVTFEQHHHHHHHHHHGHDHKHHTHEIYAEVDENGQPAGETKEHFSKEEFGEAKIRLYDRMIEDGHDQIICSVRPLQYFVGDVLHRERNPRRVTWDELFLDLIFISTISRAESYIKTDHVTWTDINKFALVFTPVWQYWYLIHAHSNRIATFDVFFKVYTFIQLLLTAGLGVNVENVFSEGSSNTAGIFITTILIGRLMYILSHCRLYWSAPEFSVSASIFIFITFVGSIPYVISLFLPIAYIPVLWWTAFLLEQVLQNFIIFFLRRVLPPTWTKYRIAFNIEHHIERFGFFSIIFLGEIVVNILWDAYGNGYSWAYVATTGGLLMAISLQWIYYNVDGSRQYTHALRLSVKTAILWQIFHYPFHLAANIGGTGLNSIISQTLQPTEIDPDTGAITSGPWSPIDSGLKWTFLSGFAIALVFLSFIGAMHKSYEPKRRGPKIAKKFRLAGRFVLAVVLTVGLGVFGDGLKATGLVVAAAVLMVALTVLEEWGKLASGKPPKGKKKKGKKRGKKGEMEGVELKEMEGEKKGGEEVGASSSDTVVVDNLFEKDQQPDTVEAAAADAKK
ncbi:hypothetical protein HDU97_010130 [Phlyctochytrium planicorne]|nr:hypothetical protein HDU97_010130 [Phlyctochytrium planicorne]